MRHWVGEKIMLQNVIEGMVARRDNLQAVMQLITETIKTSFAFSAATSGYFFLKFLLRPLMRCMLLSNNSWKKQIQSTQESFHKEERQLDKAYKPGLKIHHKVFFSVFLIGMEMCNYCRTKPLMQKNI